MSTIRMIMDALISTITYMHTFGTYRQLNNWIIIVSLPQHEWNSKYLSSKNTLVYVINFDILYEYSPFMFSKTPFGPFILCLPFWNFNMIILCRCQKPFINMKQQCYNFLCQFIRHHNFYLVHKIYILFMIIKKRYQRGTLHDNENNNTHVKMLLHMRIPMRPSKIIIRRCFWSGYFESN